MKSLKEQWENHPIRIITTACVACISATFAFSLLLFTYIVEKPLQTRITELERRNTELLMADQVAKTLEKEVDALKEALAEARTVQDERRAHLSTLNAEKEKVKMELDQLYKDLEKANSDLVDAQNRANQPGLTGIYGKGDVVRLNAIVSSLNRTIEVKESRRSDLIAEISAARD